MKFKLTKRKSDLETISMAYAEAGDQINTENYLEIIKRLNESKKPKLMVVSLGSDFSTETIEYAVNLADRMKYDILAVLTAPHPRSYGIFNISKGEIQLARAKEIFDPLIEKTQLHGVRCESVVIENVYGHQIKRLVSLIRRIEFAVVQIKRSQKFSLNLGIPVFQIVTGSPNKNLQHEIVIQQSTFSKKSLQPVFSEWRPSVLINYLIGRQPKMTQFPQSRSQKVLKTALLAAASVGLYTALFANEAAVTTYFTKGGYYALLPVFTAFAFSIIHGSFAGQCLEVLGITARKSDSASISTKKQPVVKKDQRARLNAN